MQKLIELTGILNRKRTQQIHIIGDASFKGSLLEIFYQAVLDGKVKTDAEAATLLYGTPKITAKYRNLKSALKKRLLNTVYFVNMNKEVLGERGAVRAKCWQLYPLILAISLMKQKFCLFQ